VRRLDFETFVKDISVDAVRGRRGIASPTWNDLRVLLRLLGMWKPKRCLEIGVAQGHTASLLLDHGPFIEGYVGVDRREANAPSDAGRLIKDDARVMLVVRGKGTRTIPSDEIPDAPFDWIFIDSDHSYNGVKFDTAYVQPLLAKGGVLIWHDFGVPSQFRPGGARFGVYRALSEISVGPPIFCFADALHTSSIAFRSEAYERHGVLDYVR